MEELQKVVLETIASLETNFNRGLDNVYINAALKVFLVLYAALAAPKLPASLTILFDNIFVRIGFAFMIVFMSLRDPGLAIMIAIAFIVTMQTATKYKLINSSLSTAEDGKLSWLPSAK